MTGDGPPGRLVVGVGGSLASLAALRYAAAVAGRTGASLLAVLAWEPPEGETLHRRNPDPEWIRLWAEDARRRLTAAFDEGLGGVPDGLAVERRTVRDTPVRALLGAADRPGDLLVLGGAPRTGRWARPRRAPVRRAVLERADRPVVLVPGPALRRGEARLLRRTARTPVPDGAGTGVRGERGPQATG
ncbi:universal stress protein [Streptomyces sp. NPDC058052]|uniref:universal stress protein n=1 Tax=Streptomyces sp. NPDC058052 TaxID=3346316 RepID=UPI0036E5AA2E